MSETPSDRPEETDLVTDPLGADVLLVEDNEADVRLVREAFARFDRRVAVVRDGEAAVSVLGDLADRVDGPKVLLLDMDLPGRTGPEVLRAIDREGLANLPVVVFSNSLADADVRRAYDAGANAYLAKPSDFEGFVESMEAVDRFWVRSARLPPR